MLDSRVSRDLLAWSGAAGQEMLFDEGLEKLFKMEPNLVGCRVQALLGQYSNRKALHSEYGSRVVS